MVGAPASLIPFLAHDEANRALMGTHMQCQSVPLLRPESPVVGTGMEATVAASMGRVISAKNDGVVAYADASMVVLDTKDGRETYRVEKFKRSAQSTSYNQRVLAKTGDKVKKGQVIIDGPAAQDGELALGTNVVIAYMSYDGLGYEDAIVISDRLVREDLLTSINIEEHDASVVDTKLGPEETTRDIPMSGKMLFEIWMKLELSLSVLRYGQTIFSSEKLLQKGKQNLQPRSDCSVQFLVKKHVKYETQVFVCHMENGELSLMSRYSIEKKAMNLNQEQTEKLSSKSLRFEKLSLGINSQDDMETKG